MPKLQFTSDEAKALASVAKLNAKVDELQGKLREAGRAGKTSTDDIGRGSDFATRSMLNLAGSVVSVTAAVRAAVGSYETWLTNIREVGDEAEKAQRQLTTLAAMQGGGAKRQAVELAASLAQRHGVTDRGMAFDIVQSLQSARGSLSAALTGASEIFAASKLGITLKDAQELELVGASIGAKPGEFLRKAYVAGQVSARDPDTIARAAAGLVFFKDRDFGFAAAATLAGPFGPELETYLKAGGVALQGTEDKQFQRFLRRRGLAGKSQEEVLAGLAAAGVDTPEELAAAGLADIRKQSAVSFMSRNYGDIQRQKAVIIARSGAGLLQAERGGLEAELPESRLARENDMLRAMSADAKAFGPAAMDAMEQERRDLLRGTALERMGLRELGWIDLIDERGRATWRGKAALWARDFLSLGTANDVGRSPDSMLRSIGDVENIIESELRPPAARASRGGTDASSEMLMNAARALLGVVERLKPKTLSRPDTEPRARVPSVGGIGGASLEGYMY